MDLLEILQGYALLDQLNRLFDSNEEEAERIASEIVTKYQSDYGLFTFAAFSLAKLHLRKKMYSDAIELLGRIESSRPASVVLDDYLSAELAFCKGQALEGIGDRPGARENYTQALHHADQSLNVPLARRVMLHLATLERALSNHEEARRLFDEILNTPSPSEPEVTASALIQRAEIALSEGDRSKVKELLATGIDMGWNARDQGHANSQHLWRACARILELAAK